MIINIFHKPFQVLNGISFRIEYPSLSTKIYKKKMLCLEILISY